MNIYGNKERFSSEAMVDVDMIAFHVSEDEVEDISNYLISAIITRCLMEFGQAPQVE